VVSFKKESNFVNFAVLFIIITSLIITFLFFFAYQVQKKINQKQNRFRQQENLAMEKYLKKPTNPHEIEKLVDSNFQKTRASLKKKTLSYLPNLIIPGLNILFCLICVIKYGRN
jgi:predicted PurR-regulated permease PerM